MCKADANRAGRELPVVEVALGCEDEPKLDPKLDPEAVREPDDADPPARDEPPPADKPLPDFAERKWPLPRQDDESDEPLENGIFASGAAGVARESTNTSPRMCSTYWAGTPGGLAGWVNTMCTPVAVTVSSPALFVPGPGPNWKVEPDIGLFELVVEVVADWSVEPDFVPVALPALVHMLDEGVVPDWPHELGVVVVLD